MNHISTGQDLALRWLSVRASFFGTPLCLTHLRPFSTFPLRKRITAPKNSIPPLPNQPQHPRKPHLQNRPPPTCPIKPLKPPPKNPPHLPHQPQNPPPKITPPPLFPKTPPSRPPPNPRAQSAPSGTPTPGAPTTWRCPCPSARGTWSSTAASGARSSEPEHRSTDRERENELDGRIPLVSPVEMDGMNPGLGTSWVCLGLVTSWVPLV